jgi:cellulose synthase/poly-beta-1,6-N-acetylglucosamine synthase-like glycosyltransferase
LTQIGRGEVLVVHGGSRDRTGLIAQAYVAQHPNVRVLPNARRITPAGFNIGIRAARGRYIAIMSAHSRVSADYLRLAIENIERGDADIAGGPVVTLPGRPGLLGWLLAQIVSHPFGVGDSRFRVSRARQYVDSIPFAVFRREVFERVGLFDESLPRNQDTEFFGRVAHAGFRVLMDPRSVSTYIARGTLLGLLRQNWRNSYWNVRVWFLNPHAFQLRHAVPAVFAALTWAGAALSLVTPVARLPLLLFLAVYSAMAVASAAHVVTRSRRLSALLLPPLFFLHHLAYGTGSLAGLRWFIRDRRPIQVPRLPMPSSIRTGQTNDSSQTPQSDALGNA